MRERKKTDREAEREGRREGEREGGGERSIQGQTEMERCKDPETDEQI